jgi:hypothetical protein
VPNYVDRVDLRRRLSSDRPDSDLIGDGSAQGADMAGQSDSQVGDNAPRNGGIAGVGVTCLVLSDEPSGRNLHVSYTTWEA